MSLLGLVRHMTDVERGWFRRRIAGEDIAFLYASEADPDGDFDDVESADAEQDFAAYRAEVELARQAAAGRALDETFSTSAKGRHERALGVPPHDRGVRPAQRPRRPIARANRRRDRSLTDSG